MNSRERVLAAINHRIPDKVPIDIGGTAASGISIFSYYDYKKNKGLSTDDIKAIDIYGLLAYVNAKGADALCVDTILVPSLAPRFGVKINKWKKHSFWDEREFLVPEDFLTKVDEDGAILLLSEGQEVGKMCEGGYHFSEIANATMNDIGSLPEEVPLPESQSFSDSFTDEELRFRQEVAKNAYYNTDKAVIVDMIENIRWNASIPEWLYCMALDKDRAFDLHEKKAQALLNKIKQLAQATARYSQVFAIYQDWGTQRCELASPELFREIAAPHYKRIFDWIHSNTEWKILFHSCGSIFKIIPHMIEMGVDILNPVQCNAANMEPEKLKDAYGDDIVFWGGGVDTQSVLINGSVEEIQEQVMERIRVLSMNGGYVFAPTQDIQADIPVDNIMTLIDTVGRGMK